MKTIVTHRSPDVDAITSIWLIRRYLPDWEHAKTEFVDAGETLHSMDPDSDEDIIHVDTGFGRFDHHATSDHTCASRLVLEFLIEKKYVYTNHRMVLDRLIDVVTDLDHFREGTIEGAGDDFYEFYITNILYGFRSMTSDDTEMVHFGSQMVEAAFFSLQQKMRAEKEIELGLIFKSPWGRSIALETTNTHPCWVALKAGFQLVVMKHVKKGNVRIMKLPDIGDTFEELYETLVKKDPAATWFYHSSGSMIINGSGIRPDVVPSKLSLRQVVNLLKK